MMKSQRGFSFIEVIIAAAIVCIFPLITFAFLNFKFKDIDRDVAGGSALQLRGRVISYLSDPEAWSKTMQLADNTSVFSCLSASSAPVCGWETPAGCPGAGGAFRLVNRAGDPVVGTGASDGFTEKGEPCSTFSASGNSACPIRIELTWAPVCSSPACVDPVMRVSGKFRYAHAATSVAVNTLKLDFTLLKPAKGGGAPASTHPKSCHEIFVSGTTTDGTYTIDPDASGPIAPFPVYCDMTTDGGGWTLVANQPAQRMDSGGLMPRRGTGGITVVSPTIFGRIPDPEVSGLLCASTVKSTNNMRLIAIAESDSYTQVYSNPAPGDQDVFKVYMNNGNRKDIGSYYPPAGSGDCTTDPGLNPTVFQPHGAFGVNGAANGGVGFGDHHQSAGNPFYHAFTTYGFYIDASGPGLVGCNGRIPNWTRSMSLKGSLWIR